jgi:hypothetical protein
VPRNTTIPFSQLEPDQDREQHFLASLSIGPDEQGHYGAFTIPVKDYDEATLEIRRLHRPRNRRKFKRKTTRGDWAVQYGLVTEVVNLPDGKLGVKYFATTDAARKRYMLEQRGTDPEKWSYSSNKNHKNFGA